MRRGKIGFWYRLAICVVKPLLLVFVKRDWRGRENIPPTGKVIIATNHVGHVDPLTLAHFLYESGRLPRYLAKSELFRVPLIGRLVRGAEQIPVYRYTADATLALRDALGALGRGECLAIYPEGTVTRDPQGWPMLAKTGVARLALATGAPVIPVAQWGPQEILRPYTRLLRLLPRKTSQVLAGPPVDLSGYLGAEPTVEVLRDVTETIMGAVTALVAELRGAQPPASVFDPRTRTRVEATTARRRSA
ncbi:MAG TPA: lysophospholipid acyltransferase family protein [Mycobacteriales bacterium]|nr:lysophospholipid acyltransferase family protein [Mycobacteriales bacterium]